MRAVDGVSIEVVPGHITGIIGPNGAGKSTFLAVLAGTLPATSGTIIFDRSEITRARWLRPGGVWLDEPMSGVHPRVVEEIQYYLQSLRAGGLTILMVEHELHLVEQLCDSVVVMAQGKVIGSGTMTSLRRQREIVDAYLVG